MDTRLLLLLLSLLAFIAQAELKKHGKHDKRRGREKKHRGRFEDWAREFDQSDDQSEDDDDEHDGGWLLELQEVRGSCDPNPCLNNGVCEERRNGKIKCDCPKPFKGRRCEKAKKVCRRNTCRYGTCVLTSTPPFYECKCKEPFKPPRCESDSICDPDPCQNGGKCVKDGRNFECVCPANYDGQFCQVGPEDCYEGDGESYRGKVSETEDGDECLYWNSYFLLQRGVDPFTAFDDDDGLGPHNYCRNPDGDVMPWCFIRRGRKLRWDHCDVRECSDNMTTAEPPTTTRSPEPEPVATTTKAPDVTTATTPAPVSRNATCGKPQPRRMLQRIYGGMKAIPGANPWQASLQVKLSGSNQDFRHTCGAVLIHSCWVLTAAHCINKNQDMQVVLGGLDLGKKEDFEQTFAVEQAIVHEKYRETSAAVYNDIALLKLKARNGRCAVETQYVKTVCLPNATFPDGTECSIAGWGATEDSDYGSSQLMDADVLLISQDKCSDASVYGRIVDDNMFCAGYLQGGIDSCQGDSGGPL
ncbi:hyaluronan-binding protein 2-like isoform X2 [Engraulis encrasicolus]